MKNNKENNKALFILVFCMAALCGYSNYVVRTEKHNVDKETVAVVDTPVVKHVAPHSKGKFTYHISKKGKESIKKNEGGCSLTKFKDSYGHSVGYGHFLQKGEHFDTITAKVADSLFKADIEYVERMVNILLSKNIDTRGYRFSQNFIDGFADMIYNCGGKTVADSKFYADLKNKVRYYDEECVDADIKFVACQVKTFNVFEAGHKDRRQYEHVLMVN